MSRTKEEAEQNRQFDCQYAASRTIINTGSRKAPQWILKE